MPLRFPEKNEPKIPGLTFVFSLPGHSTVSTSEFQFLFYVTVPCTSSLFIPFSFSFLDKNYGIQTGPSSSFSFYVEGCFLNPFVFFLIVEVSYIVFPMLIILFLILSVLINAEDFYAVYHSSYLIG